MIAYMLILSVQCLDGSSEEQRQEYDKPDNVTLILDKLDKDNKINLKDHKKCYVSEAEWYETEKEQTETQE